MLDQSQRTAILELRKKGASVRGISDALGVSRDAVSDVIEMGSAEVPHLERPELAEPWRDEILAQYASCKGNLIRVHEEIKKQGAGLSYQALTAFCRRHGIGHEPKEPAGRYEFAPVPLSTTTWVLSIMARAAAPPKYWRASVRKTLHSKRVKHA